mgnify:CR=1 FL=1
MRLKVFCRILFCISIFSNSLFSQIDFSGYVLEEITGGAISNVKIYSDSRGLLTITDDRGYFSFTRNNDSILTFYSENYFVNEKEINQLKSSDLIYLKPLVENLDEIEIIARNEKVFSLERLSAVEGTSIFEGKKSEVILVDQSMANLASNNSRQIFSQVAGLNIYQNDDAGLQLNIGAVSYTHLTLPTI